MKVLALFCSVTTCCAALLGQIVDTASPEKKNGERYPPEWAPLTIAVSTTGRFAKGKSWYLSANSAGNAELTIATRPTVTRRQFELSSSQMNDLRSALTTERFLDLREEYGKEIFDGSAATVSITMGSVTRTVKILHLMSDLNECPEELREPSRALRILLIVRGWFGDEEAADLRQSYRKMIDAVK